MWEIIVGVALLLPWIGLQIAKINIPPDKKWEVITMVLAIIGVICVTLGG